MTSSFTENMQSSSSIDVTMSDGTQKRIRKSTFLWTLTDSQKHLSNDRLKRVQEAKQEPKTGIDKSRKRRLVFMKEVSPGQTESIFSLSKNDELQIGDWCIFQIKKSSQENDRAIFVLGNVLCFKYILGRTAKDKQYSWEFAPIDPPMKLDLVSISHLSVN